jgi:hypothetical protein
MRKLALVLMLGLSLSACDGALPLLNGQSVSQSAPKISVEAERSLAVAHQAYNAVGKELISAANSGLLRGTAAAKAKVVYDKAGDALVLADAADRAANEANLLSALSQANSLIAQAKSLIGG